MALAVALPPAQVDAGPSEAVGIRATPLEMPAALLAESSLAFVGGAQLIANDDRFGGLSGLLLDGAAAIVVSDRGAWWEMTLERAADGRVIGVETAWRTPMLDAAGVPLEGSSADAEGLARAPDGSILVAFEGGHRVVNYAGPRMPAGSEFSALPVRGLENNAGVEALAWGLDGTVIAIAEETAPGFDGEIAGWRLSDAAAEPFSIERRDGFSPTGAAMGPDGALYLLERRFSFLRGVAMRIRRFDAPPSAPGQALGAGQELLTLGRRAPIDNMEALAVEPDPSGDGVLLTVLSDDNFNLVQRTILLQFQYRPESAR